MLSWLLNPSESHGLGAGFLRRFLSRLLIENEDVDTPFTPAEVELMRLEDVEVLREWHNIDVLVHSPSRKWALLIENKIGARESGNQLKKYKSEIQKEFPKYFFIPVFLNLEGEEPSEEGKSEGYVSISHGHIVDIAERIVEQNRSRIPKDAAVLIEHYLSTLRRLTMKDKELGDLCKAIYRKHKEAIELIVQYGSTSQVLEACEEKAKELVGEGQVHRSVNRVWFLPKEMALFQPEMSSGWGFIPASHRFPVMWWFFYYKDRGKIQLSMEVGPIADPDYRIRLLGKIKEAGFTFSKSAFRKEAKFTRIISLFQTLQKDDQGEANDEPEHVAKVAGELWKKGWAEGKKIVDVLKNCRPKGS
jgi:hypothetical protein